MKTILVTGGCGFIGSNFIPYLLSKYSDYAIINIDKLTYAADVTNLKEVEHNSAYTFIQGDICNKELIQSIFETYSIKGVIHFAAESHVDNSIKQSYEFIQTNVVGTHTLIDTAYRFWMEKPFVYKKEFEGCRFHHISTDEVYGSLGSTGYFTETTPYAPNSPYSASKAASDMIVRAYFHTYGLNIVITNCSNNFGPKQHDEKLIPTIIRNALHGNPIPIYGDGKNVRDWLYVLDHCRAIDVVYHNGRAGQTYNIGGRTEKKNIYVAQAICEILDRIFPATSNSLIGNSKNTSIKSYKELITFVEDRPGHDRRYAIDPTKIETELNWKPVWNFEEALVKTVEWYINKYIGYQCYVIKEKYE
ncbi:MAG TPA: dTDP-glucose 4,6-dehydratase [Spirochaetota bacterium]|nr:dTDP-glucose 4,6-dehydratase [Spirochaetota bacterium]